MPIFSRRRMLAASVASAIFGLVGRAARAQSDPLPSWNEGAVKKSITDFVARVIAQGGPDFVPVSERIATFDNDGCLWAEQPAYFQLQFAIDRVKVLASQHPEWSTQQPYKAVLDGDMQALAALGEKGIAEIVMATHAGITTDEFAKTVADWTESARHPRFNRPYTEMVYQPMLDLLAYLRANGFKTYIVSAGGIELMRVFSERVYGIAPEQVIGSTIVTRFEVKDGKPVLMRQPKIDFIDDKDGKPVAINKFIGRRPILAFGNSDGDLQMLQWTAAGSGARFMGLVHHTDAEREWAYDRQSHVGRLDKALDEGTTRGWTIVDMKRDWRKVFP